MTEATLFWIAKAIAPFVPAFVVAAIFFLLVAVVFESARGKR